MGIPTNYPGLTPDMVNFIKSRSYALSRQCGHSPEDREDIEQEMAIHLLSMLPKHNPERSSLPTYVNRVVDSWCRMLVRERRAACRDYTQQERSLDERGGDDHTLADQIGEVDAITLAGSRRLGSIEAEELRLAVEATTERLPRHLRELCQMLLTQSVAEVCAATGIPRTTITYRLKQLRRAFEKAGLGEP
jgi:RNA polymerase sigma factor (sigma-70 family)